MLRYDPIVFDLDGTLIDSRSDVAAAVNRTLGGLGLPTLARDEIVGYVGDGVRNLMGRTLARFDRQDVDEAVRLFKADYKTHCLIATQPYPGIEALLGQLTGARLAVVTNKPAEFARRILAGLDLDAHFAAVVGGDEARLKPDPAPVLLALERLGVGPRSGVMVGDLNNDILAGRATGLATCGVTWGFDAGKSLSAVAPDHVCHDLQQLKTLLLS